jgi:hypothetical protein
MRLDTDSLVVQSFSPLPDSTSPTPYDTGKGGPDSLCYICYETGNYVPSCKGYDCGPDSRSGCICYYTEQIVDTCDFVKCPNGPGTVPVYA